MKRIFFDTNIILDQLDSSRKGHEDAKKLECAMDQAGAQALCAWHSLSVVEYIGRKVFAEEVLQQVLRGIVAHFIIPKTGTEEAHQSFTYFNGDYEDAMQIASALKGKADCLVTRDKKGFVHCPIPVFSSAECVSHLETLQRGL